MRLLLSSPIHILHKARLPLAQAEAIKDPSHPLSKFLSQAIGSNVSGDSLHKAACLHFGTWESAVREAGISPVVPGDQHHFWHKKLVIQAIIALMDSGSPIGHSLLYRNSAPQVDRILNQVVGRPTSRAALFRAANHFFGSWERAVEVSSMGPTERWHTYFWTKQRIKVAIRALHQEGVALNVGALWRNRSAHLGRVLRQSVGRTTTGSALYAAGRTYYPGWNEALKSAGLDPHKIRRQGFWNRENVISAIRSLDQRGAPLSSGEILQDRRLRTQKIIYRAAGQSRTGRSLALAAIRLYGSWDEALTRAGIGPQRVRRRPFRWDKRSILKLIKALHGVNVPLDEKIFSRDKNEAISSEIFRLTGRRTRASWIHQLARWKFGSWQDAVAQALKQPDEETVSQEDMKEAQETFALHLRRLHENNFKLNHGAMHENSKLILAFNQGAYGEDISGLSLLCAGKKYFGSWDQALAAAQFDPLEIRKRMRSRTSNKTVTPHQVERVSIGGGETRNSAFFGDPPKDPQEILEDNERRETLGAAIEELDEEDREIAEEIFDIILQLRHFSNQSELIKLIVQFSDGSLKEYKVRNILKTIAQNMAHSL